MPRYLRYSLDFSRPSPHRAHRRFHRLLLGLMAAVLASSAALRGPALAASLFLLPARVDTALAAHFAPRYAQQVQSLTQDNAALRQKLAQLLPLEEENAALRKFSQCTSLPAGLCLVPCRTTARNTGGFAVSAPGLAAGDALVDSQGRLAGVVTRSSESSARIALPGCSGALLPCAVGNVPAAGTLQRRGSVLWVTELPRGSGAAQGEPAATLGYGRCPAGLWAGILAQAPQPSADGLTEEAPLRDTSAGLDTEYFAVSDSAASAGTPAGS
jgi:hypothetical protein